MIHVLVTLLFAMSFWIDSDSYEPPKRSILVTLKETHCAGLKVQAVEYDDENKCWYTGGWERCPYCHGISLIYREQIKSWMPIPLPDEDL